MSEKDFRKGMEAGAKPFEEKFQKISEETAKIGKGVNDKLDNISNVMDIIMDDLSDMQKKELYHLNTPYDLKEDLDDDEKEILAAVLLRLSEYTDNNEYQQKFIRAVNSYIKVTSPQTGFDLSNIENIENIKSQKIILQTVMEYMFLAKEDFSFMEDMEELFEYFSVNKKGIKEIEGYIEAVYHATGREGIAEKYGFVPKDTEKSEETSTKENMFPCYDGNDISEACADQVNIHHHYVVLKDYLVFCDEHWDETKIYCVHKQTGEKREINIEIEDRETIKACNLCGYDEYVYFVHDSGIYRADVYKKELNFEKLKIDVNKYSGEEYFPQCNEEYLVFLGNKKIDEETKRKILFVICLDTFACHEVLPDEVKSMSYENQFNGFKLIENLIFINAAIEGESYIYQYDLLDNEKVQITKLSGDNYRLFEDVKYENNNIGQYGNLIFCPRDGSNDYMYIECFCDCIDLENSKFTSIIMPGASNAVITSVAYHYAYYLKPDSSISRYDIITGQSERVIESSTNTISSYKEGGLGLRKKIIHCANKCEVQLQIVGKWLYYKEEYKDIIHKVILDEKKDIVLRKV